MAERDKKRPRRAIIGHVDHGKTTLTAALLMACGGPFDMPYGSCDWKYDVLKNGWKCVSCGKEF